ncbi:hypothetical protein TB2_017179 [Malus domestica]
MARIKLQVLLLQSKKKKRPTRISITIIVMCNLIIALVALSLVATYRYWLRRSLDQYGSELSNREDFDGFGKKGDLPGYAVEMLEVAKPFNDDPAKQENFEWFLKEKYQGGLRSTESGGASHMSEAVRARERLDLEAAADAIQKENEEWINSIGRSIVQHSSWLADSKVVDYDSNRQ